MDYENIAQNYKDQIIEDMGFEEASDEQKEELLKTLEERMSIATVKAISSTISPEEGQNLIGKAESGQPINSDLEQIFEKYPDLAVKVQDELGNLYEKLLEEAKETWSGLEE